MSFTEPNRTFKLNLLGYSLRNGVMPALALSLLAGNAMAQDSGGFGLLAALKSQAKAAAEPGDEEVVFTEEAMGFEDEYASPEDFGDAAPDGDDLENLDGAVEVSDYDLVDLHVNNEDLGNILQLLSIQSSRNIISSNNVQATVTADLYGVTFYEALDSILHVNGFGYIEKGNFIYVYTAEELAEFEALSRQPVTRIIDLDYLNATDAAEFAKMLLSESGAITANAATEAFTITDGVPNGADNYANSATIVVYDYEENVEEIQALIDELDTKPAQILIEATILQTTLNEANAFGVDFALIQNLDFTDFVGTGGPLSVVDGLLTGAGETVDGTAVDVPGGSDGTALQSTPGNTSGPATLKAGFVNGDVGVFMRVLDEITDVTVVSNPKLLTLNRQPARVLVGTRVGYLNSTTTDTSTTQSVEFLDVGTQLAVRPFVSKNGLIRLELRPQVSNFTLRQVADGAGNNVTIPDEDTTEMNTNVMVRDGQTVVLGGLFTETTSSNRSQVPVLGDIPLVGNAFKGYDDSTRRSEIIFLITPSIINDTVLAETGEMGNQYIEHARFGARKGLLPWSRERRVGQLLIDARQYADEGNIEEALAKVDRALSLSPMSADARALRSELTGKVRTAPSRSLINGMLKSELNYPAGEPMVENDSDFVDSYLEAASSEPVADSAPSDEADFEPSESEYEEAPIETFVEVPTEQVSSSFDEFEYEQFDTFDTFEPADSDVPEALAQVEEVDQTPADSILEEQASTENFDEMKSVVTGETTQVSQESDTEYSELDQGQDLFEQSAISSLAGFSGQLIIPLPTGGALRLDWPMSFDYVVGEESSEAEATFTEVPTGGDDFADFTE
jgi:type IV pilus assembly protein PilQ